MRDLNNVQRNRLFGHRGKILTDCLDSCTAAANNNAGTGGKDIYGNLTGCSFDLDLGNAGIGKLFLQMRTDLVILDQEVGKMLFIGIPTGIPALDDADTGSMRINFLAHNTLLPYSFSSKMMVMWLVRLRMGAALPRARGR